MKVELIAITPNAEELIEQCARVCYQSEPKEDYKTGTMIKSLIKNGHLSVIEHGSATFLISEISRACSHQWVRSRLASFSQSSQRYVNESQFEYVIPPSIQKLGQEEVNNYQNQMVQIQDMYNYWKSKGIKNEDSRMVLPNACTTQISTTANFREWRHIIETRSDSHAQWEIRALSNQILTQLYIKAPNTFGDLYAKFMTNQA